MLRQIVRMFPNAYAVQHCVLNVERWMADGGRICTFLLLRMAGRVCGCIACTACTIVPAYILCPRNSVSTERPMVPTVFESRCRGSNQKRDAIISPSQCLYLRNSCATDSRFPQEGRYPHAREERRSSHPYNPAFSPDAHIHALFLLGFLACLMIMTVRMPSYAAVRSIPSPQRRAKLTSYGLVWMTQILRSRSWPETAKAKQP